MTGEELIWFIQANHLEDYEINIYHDSSDRWLMSTSEIDINYEKKEIWL